jgi:chromosome segregation protein
MKLVGFKSFADRTHLEFRPGVTVVVGPNGSGKSNLVDALSWVMGTQSTKALRTGKMEDVIFAGTATRPALNRAEVTLLIDNVERNLPLDLDEVAITRRLYRDGSSDYEINGVGCRLLDIQDLLSDSGVGRNQHVIIGQGEVDKVLNSSPEEHRSIIEDAAGILKHRRRKEKAERRLERTDDDLTRLQDLVTEIERQMRPLKRQARAAGRYEDLKSEVVGLTLYLARVELDGYRSETSSLEAERDGLSGQIGSDEAFLAQLSLRLRELTERAGQLGSDLERDTAAAARLETTIERIRRIGSVAHERIRAARGQRAVEVERRADLEGELEAIVADLSRMRDQEQEAEHLATVREEEFRRLEDEERAIATQTSLSPEGAVAAARGELSVLEAAGVREGQEMTAIVKRLEVVDAQLTDETTEITRINEEIREIDQRLSGLSRAYDSARMRRDADQNAWAAAEENLTNARLADAAARARVEAIAAALQGKFDVEARRQVEESPGALGSLVSRLDVPAGLERSVEAALGGWVGAVAFTDFDGMEAAVEAVKAAGQGGVPLVAGFDEVDGPATTVAKATGLETLVQHLGPRHDHALATALLGDVLVVEGWSTAWALVRKHPELRAVTPEGDLISANGVRIAHPDGAGPAMLEAAEADLEAAGTELSRAESIHATAKRDFHKSRESERAALETVEAAEASLAGKTEAMARLQKSVDVLSQEQSRLSNRRASLADGADSRARQIARLASRIEALEGEEAVRAQMWQEMEDRRVQLAAGREMARASWHDAATTAKALIERRKLLEERARRIESELSRMTADDVSPVDTFSLEEVERRSREAVSVIGGKLEVLRERQADLRERNQAVLSELDEARSIHEATRSRLEDDRERLGAVGLQLTELGFKRENVIERVRRDAGTEIEGTNDAVRPDYPDDADLGSILEEKSAQLRRLGPINPLAGAEYAELEMRYEFLVSQLADVQSSRTELRKVISALETEIEDRFQEAFQEVAEAYQRYFALLFPGGRGRIRATEGDESGPGLTIDAQPMGKKVSTLTLLSGGERSLAALAFLFAVFEARPSPFYVLDEVEAALDDANLSRFLRIVDEFRHRAQLLVVTHQQQTMEAADVLYGITMEPGGASQAVRKDMSRIGGRADVDQVA